MNNYIGFLVFLCIGFFIGRYFNEIKKLIENIQEKHKNEKQQQ